MKTGSRLSWLVMLSTENWEMLSQLLVWISGSWEGKGARGGMQRLPRRDSLSPFSPGRSRDGTGLPVLRRCWTHPARRPWPHLHLQLHDVVHGPGLVVVVVVGDGGEAAGPLLVRDPALGEVLGRARAPDAVLGDPSGHIRCVEIVTFKYFDVD